MVAWNEDRIAERKHTAEIARAVGLRLFNIQLAKGHAISPHEFLPFPWDADDEPEDGGLSKMTEEERKASLDALMEKVNW